MKYFFNYRKKSKHAWVSELLYDVAVMSLTYVLDDHDEERKLDGKGLLGLDGAGDEVGGDVSAHDLENGGLNISIGQTLDVTVSHVLVPNLERLGSVREKKAQVSDERMGAD